MKFFYKSSLLTFICFLLLFVLFSPIILRAALPSDATITKSQSKDLWIPKGMRWLVSTAQAPPHPAGEAYVRGIQSTDTSHKETVYFCKILPIKTVDISVVDDKIVTLGGNVIGINLKPGGILVVKTEEVLGSDGQITSPAQKSGIKEGDVIYSVNGQKVTNKEELSAIVQKGESPLKIEGISGGKSAEWEIESVKNKDGVFAIGIWVRDTVAGIGTVTFYDQNRFAALGHPICDVDTGELVPSEEGFVFDAGIAGIDKGLEGSPGALKGIFISNKKGDVKINSPFGIYGTTAPPQNQEIVVGKKEEIRCKEAQIVCDIGNGPQKFEIKILRLMPSSDTSKSMVIEITDKNLLQKTGGIVQGMSGSPIIQNGKIVGAVTHVFVNDPTRGYGIFIENMLAEAEKIK